MMLGFLKTDLFRNFVAGFALGAIGLVALAPGDARDDLPAPAASAYTQIL